MTKIVALSDAVCAASGLTPQDVNVSVGRWEDRATWRVVFLGKATPEQEKAAAQTIKSFDPAAVVEEQPRDLAAEIDALKARVESVENAAVSTAQARK